jgi:hypothetical protein
MRKLDERDRVRKAEGQNAQRRFQAGGHGHGHQLYLLPTKTIRGLPTQNDRSTRRARPPPQRGGVEPEGSTSAGSGSRAFISVSRAKAVGVRAKLARKGRREKGERRAREAKPVKNKPLGEVHGRPTTRTLASLT